MELGAHIDPSGVDPNSLDDEDSDLDSRDFQAGVSDLWYILPGIILQTSRPSVETIA